MVPLMRSSLFQSVITKVNIIQSLLNKKIKKKVPALYLIKFRVLHSVSSCYNFAILMRSLCSSPGYAMQLYCVSVFPYGEPCLQQHIALLSGAMLSFSPGFICLIQYQEKSSERGNLAPALWPLCWLSLCPFPVKEGLKARCLGNEFLSVF